MAHPAFVSNLGFADPYGSTSKAVDALFARGRRDASNGMVVQRVRQSSKLFQETIEVLGRGECGTQAQAPDPLLDWGFAGTDAQSLCKPLSCAPDEYRQAWFRWMAHYCAAFAMARGGLYALVDPSTGRVVAAAATGPPKCVSFGRMSGGEMGDNIRDAGMSIGQDILANNMRMRALGAWQHGVQESQGLGNTTNYLYVVMFATAPEAQGKGCGKALLNFLGEVADADSVVAFLETAGVRNIGFYRTGGYEEVERSPCAGYTLDGGGVGMIRMPQAIGCGGGGASGAPANGASAITSAVHRGRVRQEEIMGDGKPNACPTFSRKRSTGPLSSYCSNCGGHESAHRGCE